jgi:predicted MFS family arabinose efflux permease
VVMSALIAGSVGFVLIGIAPGFLLLATGAFLAGLYIGGVFPVNVAIIADAVAPARRGTAMGLYETVCAIAFMAASVLGGTSANLLTPRMPYMLSAVVFVSCAAALAILLPYRPRQSTRFERNVAD